MSSSRLGPNRMFFRPALFWQRISEDHVAERGLEFRMNMHTGVNEARLPGSSSSVRDPDDDCEASSQLAAAKARQLRVFDDAESRGDDEAIRQKLWAAATWGDKETVSYLLSSCYVTQSVALVALGHAVAGGHTDVVNLLLQSRVEAGKPLPDRGGQTVLHVACSIGDEALARQLLRAQPCLAACTTDAGATAFDALRASDMAGMARRLESL
eukprot:NODE_3955_length_889_cov_26.216667_g3643_i0.p1 GENE.NODE_3955_length_889_cov_26.216667_g3643_i0~~NODE_3955_length_889_cov_26.216667_g3643_i0.p1  ORF type:complete len:212 (-),score=30.82 NODE_3955_length_889_cov_26.216667_g3643_i0:84-719(-)